MQQFDSSSLPSTHQTLPSCSLGTEACMCQRHRPKPVRPLTKLILDCWQREYDKRPYEHLIIHASLFRHRMHRTPTENDFGVVASFLTERSHIKSLEVNYVDLSCKMPFLEEFGRLLMKLDKISLIAVNVPVELLKIFAKNADSFRMRMLRLSGNLLTMDHANHLRCFVMHSRRLLYLDVGSCDLDERTFAMVADGVDKSKSLKAVDMSRIVNRSPISYVDENKIGLVAGILVWRCPLVEVHIKKCGFDSEAISPIIEYIPTNKSLRFLDLGSNKIEGAGMLQLLLAITKQSCMIGLDVSNNRLGEYGGEVIAHHLPKTKLKYLDIGRNQIPAKEMHLIFSTIKKTSRVRILNVTGNEFDRNSAATLSRQLITKLFLLDSIDVSVSYDQDHEEFRVVPCENKMAKYNGRYYRAANAYKVSNPFFVLIDDALDLRWDQVNDSKIKVLVNGMFVGPFVVRKNGQVISEEENRR